MPKTVFCGIDPDQILSYLQGEKDTEIRKTKPNTEEKIGKKITETPFIIKSMGEDIGFLVGYLDKIIKSDDPGDLWKFHRKYKFGISKKRFDRYFRGYNGPGYLFHFEKVEMLSPPLRNFPRYQTWAYKEIPKNLPTYSLSNEEIREKYIKKTKEIKKKMEEL